MTKQTRKIVFVSATHPATADPAGTETGAIGVIAGLTMTVPSTNGANPGRNLRKEKTELKNSKRLFVPAGEKRKTDTGKEISNFH